MCTLQLRLQFQSLNSLSFHGFRRIVSIAKSLVIAARLLEGNQIVYVFLVEVSLRLLQLALCNMEYRARLWVFWEKVEAVVQVVNEFEHFSLRFRVCNRNFWYLLLIWLQLVTKVRIPNIFRNLLLRCLPQHRLLLNLPGPQLKAITIKFLMKYTFFIISINFLLLCIPEHLRRINLRLRAAQTAYPTPIVPVLIVRTVLMLQSVLVSGTVVACLVFAAF